MSDTMDTERERIREQKQRALEQQIAGEDSAETDSPDEPIHVRDADHFEEIVDQYSVVLVDCHADWCGPCRMIEPMIEALAAETDAAVAKVDVDEHVHLAQRLGVRGVPTLVMYADGRAAERLVGVQDRDTLANLIEKHLRATN